MIEIERLVASKHRPPAECEDAMVVTEHFAVVVDGATSQTERTWDGKSGGRMAAETIVEAVDSLDPDAESMVAVQLISAALADVYRQAGVWGEVQDDPRQRATASVCVFSCRRREIWIVGDCQCLLIDRDGAAESVENPKRVDKITASARALFLEAELASGRGVDELARDDPGRRFIRPLLEQQRQFQNRGGDSEFDYWVIDGFPVAPAGVKTQTVGLEIVEVVLASDGYPQLLPTLAQTEASLRDVLARDPLLITPPAQTTKCLRPGQDSFDDRAYLRLNVAPRE